KVGSMAAFVLTAYMGGVPLIYNGQEVGCPVKLPFFSRSSIDWTTNPDMLKAYKNILAVRASNSALKSGTLQQFSTVDVASFVRKLANNEVFTVVNVRNGN